MELVVDDRDLGEITLIYPRGLINAHTVRRFESAIQRSVEAGRYNIVINCAELSYIASAGLGAMMGMIEELRENGGDLRLSDLSDNVRGIFEMLGFTHLYGVYATEGEAVASFKTPTRGTTA